MDRKTRQTTQGWMQKKAPKAGVLCLSENAETFEMSVPQKAGLAFQKGEAGLAKTIKSGRLFPFDGGGRF